MTRVDAELKLRTTGDTLVPLPAVDDATADGGYALPVDDAGARTRLDTVAARLPAALDADGGVKVHVQSSVPVSGPLTDTQLRASALPVSGPLTDAQLRASAVPVSAASLPLPAGATTEATLQKVQRAITDQEVRMDYDTRTDSNPVYIGKAIQGTATSATSWTIQKLTYDSSSRLTRAEVLTGSWDGRAGLAW